MSKIDGLYYKNKQFNRKTDITDKQLLIVKDKIIRLKADDSISAEEKRAKLKELQNELNELREDKNKHLINKTERESEAFQKPFSETLYEKCEKQNEDKIPSADKVRSNGTEYAD